MQTFARLSSVPFKLGRNEVVLIELKADRALFARLLIMAHRRAINMRKLLSFFIMTHRRAIDMHKLLSYSLGPISWSLAAAAGTLSKTVKAKLLLLIEGDTHPVEYVQEVSAWIIDGMALLQAFLALPSNSSSVHLAN